MLMHTTIPETPESPKSVSATIHLDSPKNFFERLFHLPAPKVTHRVRFDDKVTYIENKQESNEEDSLKEDPRWYPSADYNRMEKNLTDIAVQTLRMDKAWGMAITRSYGHYFKAKSREQAQAVLKIDIPSNEHTVGLESWVCAALTPNRRRTLSSRILALQKEYANAKEEDRVARLASVSQEFSRPSVLMSYHVALSIAGK